MWMTVGERIQLLRKKTGMSQIDFATKINVSKQTLYKYEIILLLIYRLIKLKLLQIYVMCPLLI